MFMIATIQMIVRGTPTDADSEWMPRNGNVKRSTQTPNQVGTAAELLVPAQPTKVVDRPDGDGDSRAEQQPARVLVEWEKGERRHEDAEEEREPPEPRHGRAIESSSARRIDDAEQPRHPADRRRQQDHDHEGDERPPDDSQVVAENLDDAVLRRSKHPSLLRAVEAVSRVP